MAFQTTNEGVPFYRPVEPRVADVPRLPPGDQIGGALLQAFTHAAITRRQAELEQQQMIQSADLNARKLDLAEKGQQQDYELKKTYYGILQDNSASLGTYRQNALNTMTNKAALRLRNEAAAQKYQDTITENDSRFFQAVDDNHLRDATFQTNDPAQWIANKIYVQNRFQTAQVGAVPDELKRLQAQADQIKVPFFSNAKYDEKTDKWVTPKEAEMRPMEQLLRQWQDPTLRQQVENGLIAAGHGSIVESIKKVPGRFWDSTTTIKTPTLDAYGKKVLKKVDLNRGVPEVPPVLQRKDNVRVEKYGQGSVEDQSNDINNSAPLPEPDLPPLAPGSSVSSPEGEGAPLSFTPTKTDLTLQHARNALAANPGARDEIMRRLASMSIDPGLLSA